MQQIWVYDSWIEYAETTHQGISIIMLLWRYLKGQKAQITTKYDSIKGVTVFRKSLLLPPLSREL